MKKKLFSMLVLLMTAVSGAVAQSYEAKVFDAPASWTGDNTYISAADLPEDFVQITDDEAMALAFPDGQGYIIYGFNGDKAKALMFQSGTLAGGFAEYFSRGDFISIQSGGGIICYTAPAGTALTPDATRKVWTLAEMPVYDVELQVEYYPGLLTFGGDAIEGGTLEVVGLTGDALPAGFEKDAEGNIYVAQGTTFTVKATPEEGYHFVCWSDDQTNTNPEREITMGVQDLAFTATFAENEYDITFSEGTNPDPENPEWTATPNPAKTKQTVTVTYTGSKKVIGVKAEKKAAALIVNPAVGQVIGDDGKNYDNASLPGGVTAVAKICYVSGDHGLALAMEDVSENTLSWDNSGANNDGKTAAEWCSAWNTSKPVKDAEWLLASENQWTNMITAAGSHTDLRDGFSSVGGSNLQSAKYWTSTEVDSIDARFCDFDRSDWFYNGKTNSLRVRACLAW